MLDKPESGENDDAGSEFDEKPLGAMIGETITAEQ